jgi:Arc-like DNA binding domain
MADAQSLEKFIVRLPEGMRDAIGIAARKNRRSMNAEIVARLAQSFDMAVPEIDPGEVPTSPTAREALELAKANAERIKFLENSLLEISSEDEFLDTLQGRAQDLFNKLAEHLRSLP